MCFDLFKPCKTTPKAKLTRTDSWSFVESGLFTTDTANNGHERHDPPKKTSSSSSSRGVFKKWLTNPVRKLSQSNKSDNNRATVERTLSSSAAVASSSTNQVSAAPIAASSNNTSDNKGSSGLGTLTASNSLPESANMSALEENSSTAVQQQQTPPISQPPPTVVLPSSKDSSAASSSSTAPAINTSGDIPDEDCDIGELDLPPPMPIQEHSYQAIIADPDTSVSSVNAPDTTDSTPVS